MSGGGLIKSFKLSILVKVASINVSIGSFLSEELMLWIGLCR